MSDFSKVPSGAGDFYHTNLLSGACFQLTFKIFQICSGRGYNKFCMAPNIQYSFLKIVGELRGEVGGSYFSLILFWLKLALFS